MSFYRGKKAVCAVGANAVTQLTDWTLTIEGTAIDCSVIGDEWKQTVQGSRSWNAVVNGYLDMGDANGQRLLINEIFDPATDGILADMRFESAEGVTSDGYFYGSAVITSIAINNPGNDGVVKCTLNMVGTSSIYYKALV